MYIIYNALTNKCWKQMKNIKVWGRRELKIEKDCGGVKQNTDIICYFISLFFKTVA